MSVFRKLLGVLLAALLLGGALQVGGSLRPTPQVQGALKPTDVQREATEEIVDRLSLHYLRLKLDDTLSQRIFEQYLKDLDPNRLFFTEEDLKAFQGYRDTLDDQLGDGVLEAGYTIFNRFQAHLESRLSAILAELENGFDDWAFDDNTAVRLDRTKADWADNQAQLDRIWDRQLKNAVLSMRLGGTDDKEIKKRLVNRYQSQLDRIKQNTSEDVFQLYMNALAQSFDPHTTYFTPHNSENFDISMSRSLEGIGAVLQYEDGYTKVVRLVPGGPAAKAGQLKPADRIVGVGQGDEEIVNVIGMRLDEVVDKIRGPKGSKVRLEIIPAGGTGEHDTHTLTIVRNKVVLEEQAAKKAIIDITHDGKPMTLGVIEIPAFYLDQYPGVLYAGPMAVLVNRYSASASEIFAGAMQDYGRALIVGDQTYGKGTVQTLLDLNHGKLKMTNAKFYRVSGSSNQNLGIVPDVTMPSLINKEQVGESTLPNAMPWDEIDPVEYIPVHDLVPLLPGLRERHQARIQDNPEFVYVEKLRGLLNQAQKRETVTLNESKRRAWQEQFDEKRLAIENAVRKFRGEEPIKAMKELRTLEEQRALDPESAEEPMTKDPYLKETGQILADLVSMIRHQRIAGQRPS
jgi:C-terminal processing protease CtpA/Prc